MKPAALLALAFAGCVLPLPQTRTTVPSVHGRVVSAHSGEPVDLAAVMVDGKKETTVMTGRDGFFATDPLTQSSLFTVWNPFAGEEVKNLEIRVLRPGFARHKQKIAWRAPAQSSVHLAEPIRLEKKPADEVAGALLR
jgi:hypothetical protein